MADRYWIAGSAANWNDTANWSASSGGAGGASVPTGSGDTAIFDGNGTGTCTLASRDIDCHVDVTNDTTFTGVSDQRDSLSYTIRNGATLTLSGFSADVYRCDSSTWNVESTGVLEHSSGVLRSRSNSTINCAGTWNVGLTAYQNGTLTISQAMTFNGDLGPDTASSIDTTIQFPSGETTITGDFEIDGDTSGSTVDLSTNNGSLTVGGDIISTLMAAWNGGTGTLTANGTGDQDWDFGGEACEDIDIDKASGDFTFSADVDPDSLTITSAKNITLSSGVTVTTTGNMTASSVGFSLIGSGGAGFVIGGNLSISGAGGNLITIDDVDFDVTGTASATYVIPRNSNASAGTSITASSGENKDGSGNSGWTITEVDHPVVVASETGEEPNTASSVACNVPRGFGGYYIGGASSRVGTPPDIAVPSGWTAIIEDDTLGQIKRSIWYITEPGSPPASYTFSKDGGSDCRWSSFISRIYGADETTFLDVAVPSAQTGTNAEGDPISTPQVTPTNDNCLLIATAVRDQANGSTSDTAPTNYTLAARSTPASVFASMFLAAYRAQTTATASGFPHWENADFGPYEWISDHIAIRSANTGGGGGDTVGRLVNGGLVNGGLVNRGLL